MTVLPRGAKNRRGGRRPGWLLLTALLVLAIVASSTLVFTNRVELLRLAVILSLWAAVLAAFVSVTYRRQSQLDEAKARDMKYVYDLQLDREISARREYELSVEAHLRRQLSAELRAQAADEMAALRAELATLRVNLQALLGTDLGDRPALESDRVTPEALPMPPAPGRVHSSRVLPAPEDPAAHAEAERVEFTPAELAPVDLFDEAVPATAEQPILDVPEEPLTPPARVAEAPQGDRRARSPKRAARAASAPKRADRPASAPKRADRPASAPERADRPASAPERPPTPPPLPPDPYRGSHRRTEPAAPRWTPPPPPPPAQPATPWRPPETRTRPGRHRSFDEQAPAAVDAQPTEPDNAGPGRHRGERPSDERSSENGAAGRHRHGDEPAPEESQGQHAGGAPVADLMARLRSNSAAGGGGRRRRED